MESNYWTFPTLALSGSTEIRRSSSAYLNLDRDDDLPGFALDAAMSRDGIPRSIMVFRDQPPAEGSMAHLSPPDAVVMPPGMLER